MTSKQRTLCMTHWQHALQIRFAIPSQGKASNVSGRHSLLGARTPGAADERRGEAVRWGRQVSLGLIRKMAQCVPGATWALSEPKLTIFTRILKPAIMQRAGVQFDHPTGANQNSFEAWTIQCIFYIMQNALIQAFWRLITKLIWLGLTPLNWHSFQNRFIVWWRHGYILLIL